MQNHTSVWRTIWLLAGLSFFALPPTPALAQPACAALEARFVESAPRDRFVFTNESSAGIQITALALSLSGSVGRLVFDTLDGGAGVEVFQPFRAEPGDAQLAEVTLPDDGGELIEMTFEHFAPAERFVFSIDVDDRLADSELGQIRVAGNEIESAELIVTTRDGSGLEREQTIRFGSDAFARLDRDDGCS